MLSWFCFLRQTASIPTVTCQAANAKLLLLERLQQAATNITRRPRQQDQTRFTFELCLLRLDHLDSSRIIAPMKQDLSLPAPAIQYPSGTILSELRNVMLHGASPFAQAVKNADKRRAVSMKWGESTLRRAQQSPNRSMSSTNVPRAVGSGVGRDW
ncbi:MAG: hypothetical protein QOD75_2116 [Blastocatellia bacterium]|jgi:hypothetical protein|nr:hypothetical protein [Blastocatellia bacterium]